MAATPNTDHLRQERFASVYEPAEDSFLLLDALEADADALRELCPLITVEIGCGSGVVTAFLGSILKAQNPLLICTDVNSFAAEAAQQTFQNNSVFPTDIVVTSFVDGLSKRLQGKIDVLLFNPPYVVTDTIEIGSRGLPATWAGGEHGRHVTDELIPQVSTLLSSRGRFYLVVLDANKPEELILLMKQRYNLNARTVLRRRCGMERLAVLCFSSTF